LSRLTAFVNGLARKKPGTRIPFLSKTADMPGSGADSCRAAHLMGQPFTRVRLIFCGISRHSRGLGGVGKESSKTTDQLRTFPLARFQQLLAKALGMPDEHFLSGARDSTCW
jgi:hypothetical protein